MTIYYHPGKPGEVSHEAARRDIAELLSNPFSRRDGKLLAQIGDTSWQRLSRRPLCAPGVMFSYLKAAALREVTQGEGR